jgi:hypothetical protein
MNVQSPLDPFVSLILDLTVNARHFARVTNRPQAGVAGRILFAQFLTELLRKKPAGTGSPGAPVFRIGCAQACRTGS